MRYKTEWGHSLVPALRASVPYNKTYYSKDSLKAPAAVSFLTLLQANDMLERLNVSHCLVVDGDVKHPAILWETFSKRVRPLLILSTEWCVPTKRMLLLYDCSSPTLIQGQNRVLNVGYYLLACYLCRST